MSRDKDLKQYLCRPAKWIAGSETASVEEGRQLDWSECEAAPLSETVDGGAVMEPTEFQACWSPDYVWFRIRCTDHHVFSRFTQRDEPLYEEDVVELFIEEGHQEAGPYVELELSPHNVVFDARVWNDGQGGIARIDVEWNMEGLRTEVVRHGNELVYHLAIPTAGFARKPTPGAWWRMNAYRIDQDEKGVRQYQAWSPTGAVNFHLPARFGMLRFLDQGDNPTIEEE
ncbi:carbohydrate-binding family 9-like protein [Paenibacillus sp. PAMC21692]|uniref:carbohydrate-binding family 9-like protein n=1 Tax=Paenibacillus sp. PAMC21692 TaxID=2762320 RepID=UPI00164D8CF9|nr:carbohydrate-binding family 9-like protein [Paenibacillus sp. PAMC21692]QNK59498.1 carbohydrate-binding family 9-like protein [Paenibacillus sp. PAMC21692]